MKRLISVLLITIIMLCVLISTGYADDAIELDSRGFASQEAFLEDMAQGIKGRLQYNSEDHSDEDQMETYAKLVGFELDRVEKYRDAEFADEKFDTLAHLYINGCIAQKSAVKYSRNLDLYNSLWNSGSKMRAGIIAFFYEQYDLDLTQEEAAQYSSSNSGTTTYTYSWGSSSTDSTQKLYDGDISFIKSETQTAMSGRREYVYTLRNNSDYAITVLAVLEVKDKEGKILGTVYGHIDNANANGLIGSGKEL